jgi:hypothetical protein
MDKDTQAAIRFVLEDDNGGLQAALDPDPEYQDYDEG